MTYIEARGLRKTYGGNVALHGIDLHIDEGRIVGLIGPNGAGKTTALNAIVGLTSYEGSLRVLGRDPWNERDELDPRRLLHHRRGGAAAVDSCLSGARLCGGYPSQVRSHEGRGVSVEDDDPDACPGQGTVEGHGHAAASRARHGHRCARARSRRADARPRPSLSQAVLRHAALRLPRAPADGRRGHAPGRRGAARPDRCALPRPRPHCLQPQLWKTSRRDTPRYRSIRTSSQPRARCVPLPNDRASATACSYSRGASASNWPPSAISERPASRICLSRSSMTARRRERGHEHLVLVGAP